MNVAADVRVKNISSGHSLAFRESRGLEMKSLFLCLILGSVSVFFTLAHADLDSGDDSLSTGVARVYDGVQQSNAAATADIAAQQSICDNDPNGDACQAAQDRIAADQAQISANNVQAQQLGNVFGQVSDQDTGSNVQVAGLKDCLYAAAVACSLLSGQGDLTQTSLSGKSIKDEIVMPILPSTPMAGSR